MKKYKSFTNIKQGEILKNILPSESADGCWDIDKKECIPRWSLKRLIYLVSDAFNIIFTPTLTKTLNLKVFCEVNNQDGIFVESVGENHTDALVNVIRVLYNKGIIFNYNTNHKRYN